MTGIDSILRKVKLYNPRADFEKIRRAYQSAQEAHNGQKRLSR